MVSFKIFLILAAMLLTVSAHPGIETTIHSIDVIDEGQDVDIEDEGDVHVTEVESMSFLDRAPKEKAFFAVKKVEAGFARTTRVGLTVQKGTYGIIHFRIRVKAVTVEQIALKAALFVKKLTLEQQHILSQISDGYDGGFDIPWLKYLGINLKKGAKRKDMIKASRKTIEYNKLAILAKALLKEVVAQKIVVRGTLKARGVSFIPTTVFSFIRLAKVYFEDGSKLLVLSDHPGDVKAATSGGNVVPSEVEEIEIF